LPRYERYQDYLFRDGRFVGEFEEMYRDFADPWHQTSTEQFASEKAVGLNLLNRLAERAGVRRVIEIGCGFGHYTARIAASGFDVLGIDVSPTAIETARSRHADVKFAVAGIDDRRLLLDYRPDIVVMAEVTWYVLDMLSTFVSFLRDDLPQAYVLHLLTTYPPGVQRYGTEFFTDLAGIKAFFGMRYLESGEVHGRGSSRTWFLGTWRPEAEDQWHSVV